MNEVFVREGVAYLVRLTEAGAVIVIFSGAVISFALFLYPSLIQRKVESFIG